VTAYDYVPTASRAVQRRAEARGLDLAVRRLNLLEWRSAFAEGARLAHQPGPRTVVARHLADATTRFGRNSLWRFASMALRDGGRLYTEYWVEGGEERALLRRLRPSAVRAELIGHGADIVHEETFDAPGEPGRRIGRTVAQWRT